MSQLPETERPLVDRQAVDDDAAIRRLMQFSLSADFLRRLIERSHRAFFVFSPDGKQTHYVSPAFEQIWGRPRSLLYESPAAWHDTLHPEDRERITELASKNFHNPLEAHPPLEYRITLPDGGVKWIWGYLFSCEDGDGRTLICGISEDVTEAKVAAVSREAAKFALEETVRARTTELLDLNERLQREIAQRIETENSLRKQRDYLNQLIHAQDLERKFISYDIHDGAIQNVIAARMHLEAGLRNAELNDARREIVEAHRLLENVLQESRRIIAGIRPPTLDDLGVGAAVEEQVLENERQGLLVELFDRTAGRRWSPSIEMTIYRVIQESLSNVRRHGQTDRARVEVAMRDDDIAVTVTDWGQGFKPADVAEREFGLRGIRDRVAAVGGTVTISSEIGRGTVVSAVIPSLDPEQAAAAQRARAEQALLMSRTRMQAVLDRPPAVVFIKDRDGRYEFINRRWEELFHVDRNTFIGLRDTDVFPPDVVAQLRANDIAVLESGEAKTIEEAVPSNDGEVRDYVSVKFPLPGEDGRGPSLCGIATDITERKREVREMRETQNRFFSFMDHMPMLAWIKDAAGKYVYANNRMLAAQGKTLEQVLGKTDFDIFPAHVAEQLRAHDCQVLQGGDRLEFRESAPAGEGPEVVWKSFKFPVDAGDGSRLVGGIAYDATQTDDDFAI